MTVLGIETSGTVGSAAVVPPSGGPAREIVFEKGLIHGVALAPAVQRLLAEIGGPRALSLVAVGLGPGSYTGVRVGVAFAKSFAFAAGLPVVGVCSHDAMAAAAPPGRTVVCVGDARRDHLYVSVFRPSDRGPVREGPVSLVPLTEAPDRVPAEALLLGDGLERFAGLLSGKGRVVGDRGLWRAPAPEIARLGARLFRERGPDDVHDLAPLYLRASEAEERWEGGAGEGGA